MSNYLDSFIEVESAQGTREVALSTRHFMSRKLFLTGEIDTEMANKFLKQFLYLAQESNEPVTVYVNSMGGQVDAGLMIYDIMKASTLEIHKVCTGIAAIMAAIMRAGGQKGHRYILKHSKVMIHEPRIADGFAGSATSIQNMSKALMETRGLLNGILAEHTGKTIEEINQATSFDNYMNAEDAIAFGLCDKVLETIGNR